MQDCSKPDAQIWRPRSHRCFQVWTPRPRCRPCQGSDIGGWLPHHFLNGDGADWSSLQVSFVIHNLPVLAHMERLSSALEKERGQPWGLAQGDSNFLNFLCQHCNYLPQGLCPEVSGGLLIVMPREEAAAFCKDMERLEVRLTVDKKKCRV